MKNLITIENLIKIIKFFKPEFYNKITWIIVISGLSIISKPLWETILSEFLNKELSINITNDNDAVIGIILVFMGLIYNLITVYFDKFLLNKQINMQDEVQKNKDKELFEEFLKTLPSSDNINFLKDHDFHNSFNVNILNPIINFIETWNNAESEFIDKDIESLRKNLLYSADKFIYESSMKTYPIRGNLMTSIPDAYVGQEWDLPPHVKKSIETLNSLAQKVYDNHQVFIRECRKKL